MGGAWPGSVLRGLRGKGRSLCATIEAGTVRIQENPSKAFHRLLGRGGAKRGSWRVIGRREEQLFPLIHLQHLQLRPAGEEQGLLKLQT